MAHAYLNLGLEEHNHAYIYAGLYQDMYDLDTDYKTFHQLRAIIGRLENVADRCCENAELLRHMALEYLET